MKKKNTKIEDIRSKEDFYKALKNKVAEVLGLYWRYSFFHGFTDEQMKVTYEFALRTLREVYLPIQRHYVNQERRKYDKIICDYERYLSTSHQRIAELEEEIKTLKKQ